MSKKTLEYFQNYLAHISYIKTTGQIVSPSVGTRSSVGQNNILTYP